jgi:hypothetical protein
VGAEKMIGAEERRAKLRQIFNKMPKYDNDLIEMMAVSCRTLEIVFSTDPDAHADPELFYRNAIGLLTNFENAEIVEIISGYKSSKYWNDLKDDQIELVEMAVREEMKKRQSGYRHTKSKEEKKEEKKEENPESEFNKDSLMELLRKTKPAGSGYERIEQVIKFVRENVIDREGKAAEIERFIMGAVCTHFGVLKAKDQKTIEKEFKEDLKNMGKRQKKNGNDDKRQSSNNEEYTIDEEFDGLYTRYDDEATGEVKIIPHTDEIANYIVKRLHVITFNDMMYSLDVNCGYYKESSKAIDSEAVRVLNGILHGKKGNNVINYKCAVLVYISQQSRVLEYPFRNTHRVIPVENGILSINYDTLEWYLITDPDYDKYVLNYGFPTTYYPKAPTEPVLKELAKYVRNPDVIIQCIAQIMAQTCTNQPFKKAYFCYGKKNYGKTFIMVDMIKDRFLTPDIVASLGLNRLSNDENNRFCQASFEGKVANIHDEMSFFNLNDANTFKAITGSYSIWIEQKCKMPYAGFSTAVHVFIANRLARFDDSVKDDDAFWCRVQPIEFNVTEFKRDTEASNRILTDEFMSGLLNLVLPVAIKMIKTGDLPIDTTWESAREEWSQSSEPAYRFIVENMERATSRHEYTAVMKHEFLKCVQIWCDRTISDSRSRPKSETDLANAIRIAGGSIDEQRPFYVKKWLNNNRVWKKKNKDEYEKDENGNLIQDEGEVLKRCYVIPWKWKNSEYANMVKPSTVTTEDSTLDAY